VAHWLAAAYREHGLQGGVLCTQERVETLCDLKNYLVEKLKVPADAIGLLHSYGKAASLPPTKGDPQSYPILLCTHSMIQNRTDTEELMRLDDGSKRQLSIWDESLVSTVGHSMIYDDIDYGAKISLGAIENHVRDKHEVDMDVAEEALNYILGAINKIKAEAQRQRDEPDTEPRTVKLPRLDRATRLAYASAIRGLKVTRKASPLLSTARDFLLTTGTGEYRVVLLRGGGPEGNGVIAYELRVPEELDRVVVLDASYLVRELTMRDSTIREVPDFKNVKTFENVTVTQYNAPGGRHTIDNISPKDTEGVVPALVEYVKSMPKNDSILICTFKTRGRTGPMDVLKDALEDAGFDLDATVKKFKRDPKDNIFREKTYPKFHFITWGQERSVNSYSHAEHVFAAGVLRQPLLTLSANVAGVDDDLCSEAAGDYQYIQKVQVSEEFSALLQLIGRGQARIVENGKARPMNVVVWNQSDYSGLIQLGLPGVNWKKAPAVWNKSATSKSSKVIIEYLKALPEETEKVSTRKLKTDTGLAKMHSTQFRRARDRALKELTEWTLEGRSLVRTTTTKEE
jgi:hypothetical protein